MPVSDGWDPVWPHLSRKQQRRYFEKLRTMTHGEKFSEVDRLNRLEYDRIDLRIRALRPTVTADDLKLYRFAILYGRQLAVDAFGWDPNHRGW